MSTEENISNLILERLNRMDTRLERMDENLDQIKLDISVLKESTRRIDHRIGYMDSFMAGFHSQLDWQQDELADHKKRLETLEEFGAHMDRDKDEP